MPSSSPSLPELSWPQLARPEQLPPTGDWFGWIILAGRGFGKTRTGAETIRGWAQQGACRRIALIGQSQGDVRDIMVLGQSGLLTLSPTQEAPLYEPSKRRLTWPNGAIATLYSGDHPRQLRGPQFDAAWIDELAKFRDPEATWDQLMLSLRLGSQPRVIVTTTPTPHPFIRKLLKQPNCIITRGSTFDNRDNLPPSFLEQLQRQYAGTSLEAQEVYAQILDDRPHVLWTAEDILYKPAPTTLRRVVVAIDPATSAHQTSDETGIVVAGIDEAGDGYILGDLSGRYSPNGWAAHAIQAYHTYGAHTLVAETNAGGQMVEMVLRLLDDNVRLQPVWAKMSKYNRALPVAMLYQQKRVFHTQPFEQLEGQMLNWGQRLAHDDRLDALVWALTALMIDAPAPALTPPIRLY